MNTQASKGIKDSCIISAHTIEFKKDTEIRRIDEAIAEIKGAFALRLDFGKVIKDNAQFQKFKNNNSSQN